MFVRLILRHFPQVKEVSFLLPIGLFVVGLQILKQIANQMIQACVYGG